MNSQTNILENYSIDFNKILGKGATGNVYSGNRIKDGQKVAIKIINLTQNQNQITKTLLQTQKRALTMITPNSNVLRLIQIVQNNKFCYIITQVYTGGTLQQRIKAQGKFSQEQAKSMLRKILSGYSALSDCYIIHRDLKPANIMLSEAGQPVIIDFGFCQIIQAKTVMRAFNVGSPSYMSPQAYSKTLFSQKSDIWALGMIFYQMLTGRTLDDELQTKKYFELICQTFLSDKFTSFSAICRQILAGTLRENFQERISSHKIKYILDKDAIQKLNKKSLTNSSVFNSFISDKSIDSTLSFRKIFKNKNQASTFQSIPISLNANKIQISLSQAYVSSQNSRFKTAVASPSKYQTKIWGDSQNQTESSNSIFNSEGGKLAKHPNYSQSPKNNEQKNINQNVGLNSLKFSQNQSQGWQNFSTENIFLNLSNQVSTKRNIQSDEIFKANLSMGQIQNQILTLNDNKIREFPLIDTQNKCKVLSQININYKQNTNFTQEKKIMMPKNIISSIIPATKLNQPKQRYLCNFISQKNKQNAVPFVNYYNSIDNSNNSIHNACNSVGNSNIQINDAYNSIKPSNSSNFRSCNNNLLSSNSSINSTNWIKRQFAVRRQFGINNDSYQKVNILKQNKFQVNRNDFLNEKTQNYKKFSFKNDQFANQALNYCLTKEIDNHMNLLPNFAKIQQKNNLISCQNSFTNQQNNCIIRRNNCINKQNNFMIQSRFIQNDRKNVIKYGNQQSSSNLTKLGLINNNNRVDLFYKECRGRQKQDWNNSRRQLFEERNKNVNLIQRINQNIVNNNNNLTPKSYESIRLY